MPRPRRRRRVAFKPEATFFKPASIPMRSLQTTNVTFSEIEAIRLIDVEEMEQEKAAEKMNISQPTLSRLLKSARKKLAKSIVNGKAIRIEGGVYQMAQKKSGQGRGAGRGRSGGGRGRMGGPKAAGPGGNCICPECGHKEPHEVGVPCAKKECPKCGTRMTRE